jgi:acetate kinase
MHRKPWGTFRKQSAWLNDTQQFAPIAVGHRVVHGGPDYDRPVLVDDQVLANLARLTTLAPLHQPHNLAPIGALLARFPKLPQVAYFDTAFHRGHDPIVDHYAIPERFYARGIRRYGFHGLSYEYVAERLREVAPDTARAAPSLLISETAPRCAPFARGGASTALSASRRLTGCRWGRGRGSSIRAWRCTS